MRETPHTHTFRCLHTSECGQEPCEEPLKLNYQCVDCTLDDSAFQFQEGEEIPEHQAELEALAKS